MISPNEMLSLSPRVGVLFVPEQVAKVVYTCFVPADTTRELYRKPQDKMAAATQAAKDVAPSGAAPSNAAPLPETAQAVDSWQRNE